MLHRLAVEPSIRSELAEWLPASAMQLAAPSDGLQTTHTGTCVRPLFYSLMQTH
jgi:hypothetical protein